MPTDSLLDARDELFHISLHDLPALFIVLQKVQHGLQHWLIVSDLISSVALQLRRGNGSSVKCCCLANT